MELNKKQTICVLTNLMCMKMIITYPRSMVTDTANSAWLCALFVSLLALVLYGIAARFFAVRITDAAFTLGGTITKRIVGVIISIILTLNMLFIVNAYPMTVKTILLVNTDIGVIISVYLLACALGAYRGITTCARAHTVFVPIAGAVMAGFVILSMPYWSVNNVMPILGEGAKSIFGRGIFYVSIFSDIIVLNLISPYINAKRDIKISGRTAIIITGIVAVLVMGTYNLIYPYPVAAEFVLPVYQVSRLVKIGSFFQRWEAFFQFVWSIGLYLYTSFYISLIAHIIADCFDMKYSRPLIFPIAVIIGSLAFLTNIEHSTGFMKLAQIFMMSVSIAIVIFAVLFNKKRKREGEVS